VSDWYQRFPLSDKPNPDILTDLVRRRAHIGIRHWDARLQKIPERCEFKRTIKDYILNMRENEQKGLGFLLYGPYEKGKTALGTIILRNALARGGRALSFRASDIMNRLASKYPLPLPNGAPLRDGLCSVNYLLVDDLEEEHFHWKGQLLRDVLRERYDEKLATVITTNLAREQLFALGWLKTTFHDAYINVNMINAPNWRSDPPQE